MLHLQQAHLRVGLTNADKCDTATICHVKFTRNSYKLQGRHCKMKIQIKIHSNGLVINIRHDEKGVGKSSKRPHVAPHEDDA